MLQWGDHADFLRERSKDKGELVPALALKPEIYPDLVGVWNAFWTLHPGRAMGFNCVGYIPLTDMIALAKVEDFEPREFITLIQGMDAFYVNWQEEHKPKS